VFAVSERTFYFPAERHRRGSSTLRPVNGTSVSVGHEYLHLHPAGKCYADSASFVLEKQCCRSLLTASSSTARQRARNERLR
jgi:hypothetical protein